MSGNNDSQKTVQVIASYDLAHWGGTQLEAISELRGLGWRIDAVINDGGFDNREIMETESGPA